MRALGLFLLTGGIVTGSVWWAFTLGRIDRLEARVRRLEDEKG